MAKKPGWAPGNWDDLDDQQKWAYALAHKGDTTLTSPARRAMSKYATDHDPIRVAAPVTPPPAPPEEQSFLGGLWSGVKGTFSSKPITQADVEAAKLKAEHDKALADSKAEQARRKAHTGTFGGARMPKDTTAGAGPTTVKPGGLTWRKMLFGRVLPIGLAAGGEVGGTLYEMHHPDQPAATTSTTAAPLPPQNEAGKKFIADATQSLNTNGSYEFTDQDVKFTITKKDNTYNVTYSYDGKTGHFANSQHLDNLLQNTAFVNTQHPGLMAKWAKNPDANQEFFGKYLRNVASADQGVQPVQLAAATPARSHAPRNAQLQPPLAHPEQQVLASAGRATGNLVRPIRAGVDLG